MMYNEIFNHLEFEVIKNKTGFNNFSLSVGSWIKQTGAKGLIVQRGKYGGTYAHKNIVIHFATWFNVEFYLYLIQEFDRLKQIEERSDSFYLNKMFDDSMQINRMARQLLVKRRELPAEDEKE